ncbi:MAG: universal stress protein [Enhydrobacter sp.]|nr:universal stress protein [Enhydrobacter sp.]
MTLATLMVHVMPSGQAAAALFQLARDVAAQVAARKVIGIAALQPLQIYAGPDAYVPQDLFQQDWEAMEKELAAAEKQFRTAFEGTAVALEWRSTITTGAVSDYVAEQMRAADLLITQPAPNGGLFDSNRYLNVADLVLRAGRPVLVAGPAVTALDLRSVVIGWNDSREARRAVEDALPLLRLAGKVTVIEVADDDELSEAEVHVKDVAEWLGRHGITAVARAERGRDEDAAVLAGVAEDLRAGLVVAGAYGHTRLREWVLGGVTRDFLLKTARCSFVSH